MQITPEQTLASLDVEAHIIDGNSGEFTEDISKAMDAAFQDQARDAVSTVINGIAGEEVAECSPVSRTRIVRKLYEVATSTEDPSAATGAAALLSTIALGYNPVSSPQTVWQRRGTALSAMAREIVSQSQPTHNFSKLFEAVSQACVEGAVFKKDEAALHLVDVHGSFAEPPQETVSDATWSYTPYEQTSAPEAAEPIPDADESRHVLAFEQDSFSNLDCKDAFTEAVRKLPWMNRCVPDNFDAPVQVLVEDGKPLAKVVNLIPTHPRIKKIFEGSAIDDEKFQSLLGPAIALSVGNTPSAYLSRKSFSDVQLTYLKKNGSNDKVYRIYFKRMGEEADKTPVIAVIGAVRTKGKQLALFRIIQKYGVPSSKLKT